MPDVTTESARKKRIANSISVSAEGHERLQQLADARGMKLGTMVAAAINALLDAEAKAS